MLHKVSSVAYWLVVIHKNKQQQNWRKNHVIHCSLPAAVSARYSCDANIVATSRPLTSQTVFTNTCRPSSCEFPTKMTSGVITKLFRRLYQPRRREIFKFNDLLSNSSIIILFQKSVYTSDNLWTKLVFVKREKISLYFLCTIRLLRCNIKRQKIFKNT